MQLCEANETKSVKALTELAQHKKVLDPAPIDSYKNSLERKWKAMTNDVSG